MYQAAKNRYDSMTYNRCGRSGLKLPAVALGLWHNFGGVDAYEESRGIVLRAFDLGVTHFDLANNYGPPPGSAEENFGKLLRHDLARYRDELIVSSKAGFLMWPGPYGEWGSRKYLLASLDQSLRRMGLDYVDIFYSHRPDPETPLEETMGALATAVRQGKALYAGISNYPAELTREACSILRELGTPCLIHQPKYSMFQRWVEDSLLDVLEEEGVGLHSVLAVGARVALGSVPQRHPRRLACRQAARVSAHRASQRRNTQQGSPTPRTGRWSRSIACANGAGLVAQGSPRDQRAPWRKQHCPARTKLGLPGGRVLFRRRVDTDQLHHFALTSIKRPPR